MQGLRWQAGAHAGADEALAQIDLDIHRTFPDHVFFAGPASSLLLQMIWWTGLAPWSLSPPFQVALLSTFLWPIQSREG